MIFHFPLSPLGLEEGSGPGHTHGQHPLFPNWDCDGERLCRAALMGQARTELQTQQGHRDREGISVPFRNSPGWLGRGDKGKPQAGTPRSLLAKCWYPGRHSVFSPQGLALGFAFWGLPFSLGSLGCSSLLLTFWVFLFPKAVLG